MQCVVSQVGGGGDLVCGNPHQQLLVVSPRQQQTASRQTEDTVLIHARLQRQHLQLLQIKLKFLHIVPLDSTHIIGY